MSQITISPVLLADLEHIETLIRQRIESRSAVLQVAGLHSLASGGRLRATLTLLGAQLGRYDLHMVANAAAAVELIHAATQIHNNLIDPAERRRGVQRESDRWGGDVTLMVGNYLFALSAVEMALTPDSRIIAYFSQAVMSICEGQLMPVLDVAPLDQALAQYAYTAGCITAALLEAACKAGIVCGVGSETQVHALGRFGHHIGLALHIMDDVHDVTGDAAGARLRAGIITLPLIYAVAANPDPRLAAVVGAKRDVEQIDWALHEINRTAATQQARADAQRHIERARSALASFPDSPAKQALVALAQSIIR